MAAPGTDTLASSGGTSVTMVGGSGTDTLSSTGGNGVLLQGGVVIVTQTGGTSITMFGCTGNDSLSSSGGSSITIIGGSGSDTLSTSHDTGVTVIGGTGNDTLTTTGGTSVTMFGGTGNDSLASSGGSSVTMVGGTGNDTMTSSRDTSATMVGGSGNSTLSSSGGTSITMFGGTGNDSLASSGGSSITIIGGSGNDSLSATGGTNVSMLGGSGNSTLSSSGGGTSVTMVGGTGNDSLASSGGTSVTMVGGTGNDTLASSGDTSVLIIGGNQIVSTTSLTSSASGSGVTFTATVSGNTLGAGTPLGFVDFFDTTTNIDLGSVPLTGGNATLTAHPGAGDTITATYGGDGTFTSSSATQTLSPGNTPTTTAMTFTGGGGNVIFTVNVSADVAGAGTPTGTVAFLDATTNTPLGSTGLDIHGNASSPLLLASSLTGHRVTATYTPAVGSNFAPSSGSQTLGGNATLSASGGTSVTMFGGTGNDSLSSSGGTSISMIGGSGNDTLSSTGGTNVTLQAGGSANDSLSSSGGTSITIFGGFGNDTLRASGGKAIGLFGSEGNNVYAIVGSGNPLNPSDFSLNDLATIGKDQPQTDSQTTGTNTIVFPGLSTLSPSQTGIHLDLSNTSPGPLPVLPTDPGQPQAVTTDITISLTGQFQNVIGTPGKDWIHGGAANNVLDGTGTGDDTLIGGSGPATLIAGSGNDSLVAGTGGTTFRFAGAPGNFSNVTVDPPAGNALNVLDFSQFGGPVTLNMASTSKQTVSGASGLRVTLQNPAEINGLMDSAFADNITGNASGDTFYVGTDNDTFTGGGGADIFFFNGSNLGSDRITETSANNTLNFYGFAGPINLNLNQTGQQTVGQGQAVNLKLTLPNPSAFSAVVGTSYNDVIQGNSTANQVLIGGGGSDSLVAGNGSVYVRGNVTQVVYLDFPLTGSSTDQPSGNGPTDSRTTLTQTVSGQNTIFSATATATGTPSRTPTGWVDFFDATANADLGIVPLVNGVATLIKPTSSVAGHNVVATYSGENPAGSYVYTAADENAILQGVQADYAAFDYFFTLDPAVAAQKAQVTGGQYVTILFNAAGVAGGASNVLDPENVNLGGLTLVNVNPFLGDPARSLVTPTIANVRSLTTTIAAHELGHQSGLQHQDAFSLIGSGIYSGVNPNEFFPTYTGPVNATQTPNDIMASPASVGSTLQQAAGATYVGERDAVKLAFNDTGSVLQQQNFVLEPVAQHNGPSDLASAYYVSALPASQPLSLTPLAVPNTLPTGLPDSGKTFNVTAVAINGTLATNTQEDFYAFSGQAGQLMNFQVISFNNTLNAHPIIPELVLVGPNGQVLAYNVHEFESPDSTLLDVTLPTTGTYYVGVDSLLSLTAGNYQLFMYTFATTGASGATGDTMVGGTGNDTMYGSSGNDLFLFAQGSSGNATLYAGSGQNTLNLSGAPGEHVTLVPPDKFTVINSSRVATTTSLASSANPTLSGQALTLTATVASGSGTPAGTVDFFDNSTNTDLGSVTVGTGGLAKMPLPSGLAVGTHSITATYAPSATSSFLGSISAPLVQTVTLTSTAGTSAFVLNGSAAGALSVSGQAQLTLSGLLDVNSSSTSAISVSGNAQVTAGSIQVVGKVQSGGNAHLTPSNPTTGVAPFGDPLINLPLPPSGLPLKGAVNLSGNNSLTISSGVYSQISVSGNGKLTMNPGIYVIAGGGFSVTGGASVTGAGVTIYNAGSSYPNPGGSFGAVNLSGSGNISLTAPTIGTYAGILIFQARDNASAISLTNNGISMPSGVIYAPKAALTVSGNGQYKGSFVVNTLTVSGNAIAQLTAGDGSGTVYAPAQVRTAYGINNLSLDGTGQTIAIVDAYDNPAIYRALDAFDAQFAVASSGATLSQFYGAASSFLTVVNQRGDATALPATDPAGPGNDNWEVESALDVEWAHAVAPGAQIVLVEADSQSLDDLMTAVRTAAGLPGVSVVSMSWGFPEGQAVFAQDEALYDSYLTTPAGHPGVTFVASTGDYGAGLPLYPAFSPNVVAVGGTSLTLNTDNSYKTEVGWGAYSNSLGVFLGGGGGLSRFQSEPTFQQGVQSTGSRATPDVSLLADPATGAWIADPYNLPGDNPWEIVGGTSLSAPAWAALFALVDQGRVASGKATLGTAGPTEAQTALYGLSKADFHDVTGGSNGYSAGAGFDLVTGLGTPLADLLVPDLIAFAGGPASATPVAPIAAASLVLSADVGSVSATMEALTQAAVLHVFSAQPLMSHAPAADSGEALQAVQPRPTTAEPGRNGAAASGGRGAPVETGSPVAGPTKAGLTITGASLAAVTPSAAGTTPQTARRWNATSESVTAAPAWSAILLDASSAIGQVPALMAGALRPEMPAGGSSGVLLGGAGDDLLVGGEGRDLLVGGYSAGPRAAASRQENAARGGELTISDTAALDALMAEGWRTDGGEGSRFFDEFLRNDEGDTGADVGEGE